jgi:3-hydroxyisobutyrate dehydrogenase-like beta-hydroxyacid dehydrogenase
MKPPRIGLVGYGEVGQMLGVDLDGKTDGPIAVYDVRFDDAGDPLAKQAKANGFRICDGIAAAAANRDLVISAVTAGSARAVADAAAGAR